MARPSPAERLALRCVRQPSGCLEWTGGTNRHGYGFIRYGNKTVSTHRLAWELANGRPIPEGMCILHSCDNPPCCEPSHLRPGTHADNAADRNLRGRGRVALSATHCLHGHPWSKKNTMLGNDGYRRCRVCGIAAEARYIKRRVTYSE